MSCPSREELLDFSIDALEDAEAAEVTTHISRCLRCQEETKLLKQTTTRLASLLANATTKPFHGDEQFAKAPQEVLQNIKDGIATINWREDQDKPHSTHQDFLPDLAQKKIGKYELKEILGRGGQASAFLAYDPDLERNVVLKRYRENVRSEEQVLRDGRLISRIDSPFVAKCYAVYRHDEEIYLVIECIQGLNLDDWCKKKQPTMDQIRLILGDIAKGLSAIHHSGLVHRDIKPANIVLSAEGKPRIIDFGIATQIASEDLRYTAGTIQYMSPEQANADASRIDQRTDIFSLGAVMYYMLTGRPPYQSINPEEVMDAAKYANFKPPREINPDIPKEVEQVCLKAMAADPTERYGTADEFRNALMPEKSGILKFVVLFAAAVVLGIWFFWHQPEIKTPIEGTVDVLLSSVDQDVSSAKRFVSIQTPGALPANTGELVQIKVKLNQPAFIYVVWIDAEGSATPIYPQNPIETENDEFTYTKSESLTLPIGDHEGYPLEGMAGLETVVVLARREQLSSEDFSLISSIEKLPPTAFRDSREWMILDLDSKTVMGPENQTRSINPSHTQRINDPLMLTLENLQKNFEEVVAVRFAFAGVD